MLSLNWVFIYDHFLRFPSAGLAGEAVERGSSSVPEAERVSICCSQTGEVEAAGAVLRSRDPDLEASPQIQASLAMQQ